MVNSWVTKNFVSLLLQARKLEAQLDEQMNSYRKLVSTKVSTKVDLEENDLESGIDRLLKQLQQVNMQMQDWVSSGGSEMVSHTLTRHQEILQDLTQNRLLKEHAAISRSTGQMDSVISQAQASLGALVLHRSTFGGINSKLSNVSSLLPSVNHILSTIKRKKVYGYHHNVSRCICMHVSYLRLLVEQVTMYFVLPAQ
ncbi:hypothetical protein CRYUN_Cryun37aG0023400 [Craigia yunnanensis]